MGRTFSTSDGRPKLAFAYRPSAAAGVFCKSSLERLDRLCNIVRPVPLESFDDDAGRKTLSSVDVLVTCWGSPKLDAKTLEHAPNLKLVAHAAGSVKSLIDPCALDRGITLVNAASANAIPVAEFTLAAILMANKQVMRYRELYRTTRDTTRWDHLSSPSVGNWKKTVGIVGASRIGRRVIDLLEPFDLDVQVYDPYRGAAFSSVTGIRNVDLDELMATSDIVSLHAPSLDSTHGMIDARRLALIQDGATLINTARGALVDQVALERELVSGRIWAVLDVTTPDVLPADSVLYDLSNVLLTPHIAGAFGGERERLGTLVVDEVERFVTGLPLQHTLAAATLHLQA